MVDKNIENQKALFSIAHEIERFQIETSKDYGKELYTPQPTLIEWYIRSIKAKNKLIISLKKKLSIACEFAKILRSINVNRNGIKSNDFTQALIKSSNRKLSVTLYESVSTKLINDAHKGIFFNKDERTEIEKLKEIICHLNSTNIMLHQEKENVKKLERKNHFLRTKLLLTEKSLRSLISQTDNMKKDNNRLRQRKQTVF